VGEGGVIIQICSGGEINTSVWDTWAVKMQWGDAKINGGGRLKSLTVYIIFSMQTLKLYKEI